GPASRSTRCIVLLGSIRSRAPGGAESPAWSRETHTDFTKRRSGGAAPRISIGIVGSFGRRVPATLPDARSAHPAHRSANRSRRVGLPAAHASGSANYRVLRPDATVDPS